MYVMNLSWKHSSHSIPLHIDPHLHSIVVLAYNYNISVMDIEVKNFILIFYEFLFKIFLDKLKFFW